jgi:hypothetical protein
MRVAMLIVVQLIRKTIRQPIGQIQQMHRRAVFAQPFKALYILTLAILCLAAPLSSLGMTCPSNETILQLGDSVQETINRCGQALAINTHTIETPIDAEWTYFIPNQTKNEVAKLVIRFSYGKIANLTIGTTSESHNLRLSNICKFPIQIGDSMEQAKQSCGNPLSEKILQTMSTRITELKYKTENHSILIFENDQLIDWK